MQCIVFVTLSENHKYIYFVSIKKIINHYQVMSYPNQKKKQKPAISTHLLYYIYKYLIPRSISGCSLQMFRVWIG